MQESLIPSLCSPSLKERTSLFWDKAVTSIVIADCISEALL